MYSLNVFMGNSKQALLHQALLHPSRQSWTECLHLVMLEIGAVSKLDFGCSTAELVYGPQLRLKTLILYRQTLSITHMTIPTTKKVCRPRSFHHNKSLCDRTLFDICYNPLTMARINKTSGTNGQTNAVDHLKLASVPPSLRRHGTRNKKPTIICRNEHSLTPQKHETRSRIVQFYRIPV